MKLFKLRQVNLESDDKKGKKQIRDFNKKLRQTARNLKDYDPETVLIPKNIKTRS